MIRLVVGRRPRRHRTKARGADDRWGWWPDDRRRPGPSRRCPLEPASRFDTPAGPFGTALRKSRGGALSLRMGGDAPVLRTLWRSLPATPPSW